MTRKMHMRLYRKIETCPGTLHLLYILQPSRLCMTNKYVFDNHILKCDNWPGKLKVVIKTSKFRKDTSVGEHRLFCFKRM